MSRAEAESITGFRAGIGELLARQAGTVRPGHLVVFAVDGANADLARSRLGGADIRVQRSVCPTTSSANWLSALTGTEVEEHGVPGVVFRHPDGGSDLVHFLDYHGTGLTKPRGNIFSDAADLGFRPLAVLGDLEGYTSAWRDALLAHCVPVPGHRFFTEQGHYARRTAAQVLARVRTAVDGTLAAHGADQRCLVWCYVELDQHVHRHGYDEVADEVMTGLDHYARVLTERGAVVALHADHGLVPTVHDPGLAELLDGLGRRHGFTMGGAGRMRWLYPQATSGEELAASLLRELPDSVRICPADGYFAPGSEARRRVGDVLLIAQGERFLTEPDYRYDHGSLTPEETDTPFAVWR